MRVVPNPTSVLDCPTSQRRLSESEHGPRCGRVELGEKIGRRADVRFNSMILLSMAGRGNETCLGLRIVHTEAVR